MDKTKVKIAIRENKCVRLIAKPFASLQRALNMRSYLKSDDSKFIRSLKDAHKNESCFIIGNGPSLLPTDLDQIEDMKIDSFGSNRIFYIYDKTKWRPTYYVSMDLYGLSKDTDLVLNSGDYEKFLNYKAKKYVGITVEKVHFIFSFGEFKVNPYVMESSELSEDCSIHVSKMATVTANAIELAIYMGYSTIYLLGVDNNYVTKRLKNGSIIKDSTMKTSYFAGMKDSDGRPGDGFSVQTVDFMNESYEVCKLFAEKRGVKIYNATRGGKLEIFERVDFDTVMQSLGSNS